MSSSSIKSKTLITVLSISIAFAITYGIKKSIDNKRLNAQLEKATQEKEVVYARLTDLSANYKNVTAKNKKLSRRVISEINKIISLKDSVNELDNYLKTDQQTISEKTSLAQNLANENKNLTKKLTEAETLKTSLVSVTSMRKKTNGKFSETSKAKKTDAVKINFNLQENKLASNGERKVNIELLNAANAVIYTDEIFIDYNNELLEVTSLIEITRGDLQMGKHSIKTYLDDNLLSKTDFTLN